MKHLVVALLLIAAPAAAQMAPGMTMPPASPAGQPPEVAANKQAMDTMMKNMATTLTGDADHDFVAGMLPHHQGAVDMARVELRYGRDPALRRLARNIVASQSREITFMRQWQQQHPAP